VIYPMFAMVLLTAVVLVILFRSRVAAVQKGLVSAAYYRIYQGAVEPESTAKSARHFAKRGTSPHFLMPAFGRSDEITYLVGNSSGLTPSFPRRGGLALGPWILQLWIFHVEQR